MSILELNRVENKECHKKCSKDKRKNITIDDLCVDTLSVIDGYPVRCVGDWAERKIFHLVQYFGIFARGMHNKWAGLNYIEICSGPGRCIDRSTGTEFDGTALAIANHKDAKYLKNALFFDFEKEIVVNLNKRLKNCDSINAEAFLGDYNESESICSVLRNKIPDNHLNIVFIDPTDCSLPFQLVIDIVKTLKNVDFIINVASGTDFNRNIGNVIQLPVQYEKTYKKYSKFLGNEQFFNDELVKELSLNGDFKELRKKFRDNYVESLKKLEYKYFDYKPIKHYYDLIYASKHMRGIDFWRKANSITFEGQREMFF